ncbi:response regulator transcription factor [Lachnotalea sp. AF33-28]|jgi:two-component system response regulator ResD|uniref:response regulator transcription factor n=1 Tax=Lachnotalea sp. AF33-28 TaxID=2292046 RepID=UPI000E507BAA|nr:response regulator transcription factor [Lachnotalea sp. AF33-28]RHP35566.1 DNA-binding response regulator [Lachnotalea sp. AF33-28]
MARILIVDDEEKIRSIIRKYAEHEGYEVSEAADGQEAVYLCRAGSFDCIVLDVMMPMLDGFAACREIHKYCDTPVIMLSARGEEYDRIHGFELGVDDYVVKPFSPRELMLRIRVVITRNQRKNGQDKESYSYKGLHVNFAARKVSVDGRRTELTLKEYELLSFLIQNKGIALSREQLITGVWGYDYYGDDRTLDTHVKKLRGSLGPYRDCLVTLRGVGYRFEEP